MSWEHEQKERIEGLAKFPAENPNPVMRITVAGDIIYANDGSLPLLDVWDAADTRQLPQEWQTLLRSIYTDARSMEKEIRAGRAVYLVLFLPIPNSEYITVYGRDITERKRADEHLDTGTRPHTEAPPPASLNLHDAEERLIREALRCTAGKIEGKSGAATLLGIAPSTLRDRIRRLHTER